jgi:hypothetical protein
MGYEMVKSWQQEYMQLADFVQKHPKIKILDTTITIPSNVRSEFYKRFNNVRKKYLYKHFREELNISMQLCLHYKETTREIIDKLNIERVNNPNEIHQFLENPEISFNNDQFDDLFDLLRDNIGFHDYNQRVLKKIDKSFQNMLQAGFERWALLSISVLLNPDSLFAVNLQPIIASTGLLLCENPGSYIELPDVLESKDISFNHDKTVAFTVPDFIIYSPLAKGYASFRIDYNTAMIRAPHLSLKREWYSRYAINAEEPGMALIYLSNDKNDIRVISDKDKLCRPDLVLEIRGSNNWYNRNAINHVLRRHRSLKPRLGTYILSSYPQRGLNDIAEEGIRIITTGLDKERLYPIIEMITNKCGQFDA